MCIRDSMQGDTEVNPKGRVLTKTAFKGSWPMEHSHQRLTTGCSSVPQQEQEDHWRTNTRTRTFVWDCGLKITTLIAVTDKFNTSLLWRNKLFSRTLHTDFDFHKAANGLSSYLNNPKSYWPILMTFGRMVYNDKRKAEFNSQKNRSKLKVTGEGTGVKKTSKRTIFKLFPR